jgi:hypothetical protein
MPCCNKSKVDGMRQGPNAPRPLDGGKEIVLQLDGNATQIIAIRQSQVRKINHHKDGAAHTYIDPDDSKMYKNSEIQTRPLHIL